MAKKKKDSDLSRFESVVSRCNRHLSNDRKLIITKDGSHYNLKTITGKRVAVDMTAAHMHYVLEGVYEGISLKTHKKKST